MANVVAMPLSNTFEKLWLSGFLTGSHITFLELNWSDVALNAVLLKNKELVGWLLTVDCG